jgi:CBS domain-containing protein
MTSEVTTCDFDMHIEDLARVMTDLRIRHVPVVVEGKLMAIVSIGDVVKNRIDELQAERDQLVGYIQQ